MLQNSEPGSPTRGSRYACPAVTTAHHEAGHAVVALNLGLLSDHAAVTLAVEAWGVRGSVGLRLPSDYSDEKYPEIARGKIVSALAGPVAEIRASGTLDLAGAAGDLNVALDAALALDGEKPMELVREAQARAEELVAEHWQAIEAVAAALLAEPAGLLSAPQVRRLSASTDARTASG